MNYLTGGTPISCQGYDHRTRPKSPVVVVGGGIAGVACARVLTDAGVPVVLRDRARLLGGRLGARTLDRGRPDEHVVDLGAAYFTVSDPGFAEVAADWQARGLARPWTDTLAVAGPDGLTGTTRGPMRWAGTAGLRSLVDDLATGLSVRSGEPVTQVRPGPMVDGEPAAAVVLAMPDPQAERLLHPALTAARAQVVDRAWEPVLSLWAGWDRRSWPEFDAAFVNDHPVLGLLADDGARRGDGAPVLVAHSTSGYAAARLAAADPDPDTAAGPMIDAVCRLLAVGAPQWAHVHRWSLARPSQPRSDSGSVSFHLDDDGIALCGDGWGPPRVQTAWRSGTDLGHALVHRLA